MSNNLSSLSAAQQEQVGAAKRKFATRLDALRSVRVESLIADVELYATRLESEYEAVISSQAEEIDNLISYILRSLPTTSLRATAATSAAGSCVDPATLAAMKEKVMADIRALPPREGAERC